MGDQEPQQVGVVPSWWESVPQAPPDPILGLTEQFKLDLNPNKLNLGVGAYRTEEGKPYVLPVVQKTEQKLIEDAIFDKEYLPIIGLQQFNQLSKKLAFSDECSALAEDRITTVQCLSGTGSLRVGAEFLAQHHSTRNIYLPTPSWGNHKKIFACAGFKVRQYRYYHPQSCGLDYEGLITDLQAAESGSVILFHVCAHNPTGVDPTLEQWQGIQQVCQQGGLLPFFDSAYQGFASGDLDKDAASLRLFAKHDAELLLAQSYAKNMGLYGERVGALSVLCRDPDGAKRVQSQLKQIIRPMYSNPPRHGAEIVATILQNQGLFEEWKCQLKAMSNRIGSMREALFESLRKQGVPGSWDHILKQIGMFSFTGLDSQQVQNMVHNWHIYMTTDGRISMAGLSKQKCEYLAQAIKDSVMKQRLSS